MKRTNKTHAAHDALAASNPRFENRWLSDDTYLRNLVGCNLDGMYVGEQVDDSDWVTATDGRALNGEALEEIGDGWAIVRCDWRNAEDEA